MTTLLYYWVLAVMAFLALFPATILAFIVCAGMFRAHNWLYDHANEFQQEYPFRWMAAVMAATILLVLAIPSAVALYVLDVLFNKTYGRLLFMEGPSLHLFSHRVQWWVDHAAACAEYDRAVSWAHFLNYFWPGHIILRKDA